MSSSSLTESDIPEVLRVLSHVTHKWKDLGIGLRIEPTKLEMFKRDDPRESLREMILYWIHNFLDTSNWETLANALEEIERKDLAIQIRRLYSGTETSNIHIEAQKALTKLEEKRSHINKTHLTALQCVNDFSENIKDKLNMHDKNLKQEFRKHQKEDKDKEQKLKKELELEKRKCEEQKIKLQKILSRPSFGLDEIDEVSKIKETIRLVKDQREQIESEINDFEQSKISSSLADAELDNVEFVIEELMSHLKTEDIYVHGSITSQDSGAGSRVDLTGGTTV